MMTLDQLKRQAVLRVLAQFGGDKVATARALGCSRRTVYNLLVRWKVPLDYGRTSGRGTGKRDRNGNEREILASVKTQRPSSPEIDEVVVRV